MTTSGTVAKISTNPRSASIQKDPPPAGPIAFSPLDDDQWAVLRDAQRDGASVTVTGSPPNATSVSRP